MRKVSIYVDFKCLHQPSLVGAAAVRWIFAVFSYLPHTRQALLRSRQLNVPCLISQGEKIEATFCLHAHEI